MLKTWYHIPSPSGAVCGIFDQANASNSTAAAKTANVEKWAAVTSNLFHTRK